LIQVLTGPPNPRWAGLPQSGGHPERDPRVPDLQASEDHTPSLRVYGDNRRVPGLRREEVALLAGVSVDYYTRLERGNMSGVSESVLEALARALQLDEAERAHLFDLAGPRTRRLRRDAAPSGSESGPECSASSTP
jgi:helix-turn-helix protein